MQLYPTLDIAGLQLLLVFRGRIYELQTQKKDFMELNVKLKRKGQDDANDEDGQN